MMPQVLETQKKHQKHRNLNLLNLMDPVNGFRVMIIDHDEDNANHTRDMLHQLNFHVEVFTNPREALDFLNDHAQDIDFLLVAVEMEEIPGFEFLERATEMYENIQVISPRANTHDEQSNARNSSTEKEYIDNDISEVQSSTGSNSIDMGLVDYPDSEDGETVDKDPKGDQDTEVGTSPKGDQDSEVGTSPSN
ncbi:hypothetical protein SORBI_3006G064700 [Sorghum bicolor]|uniref:Response regulatory domain-containing protein n=2 Tax=Sorghum bicolor TaxID=4558 RepID=A0A1Z5RCN2_SORBI|nr:hypothetical protein SORBI_3006G064700 [Sorghum bicolor]